MKTHEEVFNYLEIFSFGKVRFEDVYQAFKQRLSAESADQTPVSLYLETRMTTEDMRQAWGAECVPAKGMRNIANAALRHAIDAGHVIPLDQHIKEMGEAHVGGIVAGRSERDMAIAEAVRDWHVSQFPGIRGALSQPQLDLIIARVPK